MQVTGSIAETRVMLTQWRQAGARIALVPTMGNLHDGHLRLVQTAKQHADRVAVSIFVNPLQFGVGEDFTRYPRTATEDLQKLQDAATDWVFMPKVTEMYPDHAQTQVTVSGLSDRLCGQARPGHFTGVATVVLKLLNIFQPEVAIFGEKDYQQLAVIRAMVRDLNLPVAILGVPTVREASGLALSSRNQYLTAQELKIAPLLYQTLSQIQTQIQAGQRDYADLAWQAGEILRSAGFRPDYVEICRAADLQPATETDSDLVILVAAYLGAARLIDNLAFSLSQETRAAGL